MISYIIEAVRTVRAPNALRTIDDGRPVHDWVATVSTVDEAMRIVGEIKTEGRGLAVAVLGWDCDDGTVLRHHNYALRNCANGARETPIYHADREWRVYHNSRPVLELGDWEKQICPSFAAPTGGGGAWKLTARQRL